MPPASDSYHSQVSAALISGRQSVYQGLNAYFGDETPTQLHQGLIKGDSGVFYSYFITDFVQNSQNIFSRMRGAEGRASLRQGLPESLIGLSPEAETTLNKATQFLYEEVFTEPRTRNRTEMLKTVSLACVELLYNGAEDVVSRFINDKAALEQWPRDKTTKALELTNDPIHRVQVAVDILSDMGDQEIYDFVGIQSL